MVDERAWGGCHRCTCAWQRQPSAAAARSPLEGVRASLRKFTPRKEPAASGIWVSFRSRGYRSALLRQRALVDGRDVRDRIDGRRKHLVDLAEQTTGQATGGRDPADETRAASQRAGVGASLKPRLSSLGSRAHSERTPRRAERGRKPMGLDGPPSSEPRRGTTVAAPRAIDLSRGAARRSEGSRHPRHGVARYRARVASLVD